MNPKEYNVVPYLKQGNMECLEEYQRKRYHIPLNT